jgi:hypothetical protein
MGGRPALLGRSMLICFKGTFQDGAYRATIRASRGSRQSQFQKRRDRVLVEAHEASARRRVRACGDLFDRALPQRTASRELECYR